MKLLRIPLPYLVSRATQATFAFLTPKERSVKTSFRPVLHLLPLMCHNTQSYTKKCTRVFVCAYKIKCAGCK